MKLKFLGTAAAEGIPAVFCGCEKCKKAWRLRGRNIRTRSQALIDGRLLIDFPPDTYWHSVQYGIDLTDIHHCLLTHIHQDHWYPEDLDFARDGYSYPPADWPGLRIYGSADLVPDMQKVAAQGVEKITGVAVEPFVPFAVGDYTVTALKAAHGTANPYIYLVSDGEKTLLYANDTNLFPEETWAYLKACGVKLDLVSLDCTGGAREDTNSGGHMTLAGNRICRARLRETGAADEKTVFILNHFSHNGTAACYDDLVPIAREEGFLVSYDGMEVVI